MSLKRWFGETFGFTARSAPQKKSQSLSEEKESHLDYMAKVSTGEIIRTPGILGVNPHKLPSRTGMDAMMEYDLALHKAKLEEEARRLGIAAGGGAMIKKAGGGTIILPADADGWALVHKEGDKFLVRTKDSTLETENFFDAMIQVAKFYGVDLDESADSKE